MFSEILKIRMIFRLLRDIAFVYIGVYSAIFFYGKWEHDGIYENSIKLMVVTIGTLIYCYGAIALIRDIKNGALWVIYRKIKNLWKARKKGKKNER